MTGAAVVWVDQEVFNFPIRKFVMLWVLCEFGQGQPEGGCFLEITALELRL
jgi:hypothetical protein